ncbi:uncharacterized protein LOC143178976 [Calliopsis andreniformis]|uniref:uncharacterized protein LOC143178976 n=1 Tax=Calliopsis andreniformis TaxID=337506 RepID=UPI003FCDCB0F
MAPVKRRPHTRSRHKMKLRHRKPNIPELVFKFLSLGSREVGKCSFSDSSTKCPFCKRPKRHGEVLNSLDDPAAIVKSMANKRKDSSRKSKRVHHVKRRQTAKNQKLSACMYKCEGNKDAKKMKKYIQKALEFGVESGYLIPKDAAYKVLRVSSDLMCDGHHVNKARYLDRAVSRDRSPHRAPIKFEDCEVQDARRRRRSRRRRRRSRSRSRRRRRRGRRLRSRDPEMLIRRNFESLRDEYFDLGILGPWILETWDLRTSKVWVFEKSLILRTLDLVKKCGILKFLGFEPLTLWSGSTNEVAENEDDDESDDTSPKKKNTIDTANREVTKEHHQSDGEKTDTKRDEGISDLSADEDETDDEDEKKRDDPKKTQS